MHTLNIACLVTRSLGATRGPQQEREQVGSPSYLRMPTPSTSKHDLSRSLPRVFLHIGEPLVDIVFSRSQRLDMMHMQCTLVSSQEPGARSTIYTCLPFVIKDPDLCWARIQSTSMPGHLCLNGFISTGFFSCLVFVCSCCRWCVTPHCSVCLQLEKRSVRYGRGKKERKGVGRKGGLSHNDTMAIGNIASIDSLASSVRTWITYILWTITNATTAVDRKSIAPCCLRHPELPDELSCK